MSKSISKNIIFKFILNIFNIVVPILTGPYVVRKLNPDLMGNINFAESLSAWFFVFASFGIYQYGLREISRVKEDKEALSRTFTSLFIITIITNVITTIAYITNITYTYGHRGEDGSLSALYITCVVLSCNLISNIFYTEWVNEALENYDFITIKTIVVRLVYTILLFVVLRSSDDFYQYLVLMVGANFINNFASFVYIKKKVKFNFTKLEFIKHLKPMFLVVILSNSSILYTQLDKTMVGMYIGAREVSFYQMAQKIMLIVNTLMLTAVDVTIPRLSFLAAKEDDAEYLGLINKISRIYFLLLFPASIGMFVLAKEIIFIYGGSKYMESAPIFAVFALYMITIGFERVLSNQVIYAKRQEKSQIKIIFACGILNLIMNILLLKFNMFTAVNAVITTLIANIFIIIWEYMFVRKTLKVNLNLFTLDKIKYLFISLVFIPIAFVVGIFIGNIYIYTVVVMVISSIAYFGILYASKDEPFEMLQNQVMSKLKLKRAKK